MLGLICLALGSFILIPVQLYGSYVIMVEEQGFAMLGRLLAWSVACLFTIWLIGQFVQFQLEAL